MINLNMQLKSIIFSFLYGVLISLIFNLIYFLIFSKKKVVRIFFSTIFVINISFLYFYILEHINYGYIHIYLLLFLLAGFLIFFKYFKKKLRKVNVKK